MGTRRVSDSGRGELPLAHYYDFGEEPIDLGPPGHDRAGRRRRRPGSFVGLAVCAPVYAFVIGKLLGH